MKNSKKQASKLSLDKFKISKINNPHVVFGGQRDSDADDEDNTVLDTKKG